MTLRLRERPVRKVVIPLAGLVILIVANYTIVRKENLLASGRTVLLEIAPVDPRSLMQGDYMSLRFRVQAAAFGGRDLSSLEDGRMVLTVDERSVGTFARLDDGSPIAPNEVVMRYRVRLGVPS